MKPSKIITYIMWGLFAVSACFVGLIFFPETRIAGVIAVSYFVWFLAMVGIAYVRNKIKNH